MPFSSLINRDSVFNGVHRVECKIRILESRPTFCRQRLRNSCFDMGRQHAHMPGRGGQGQVISCAASPLALLRLECSFFAPFDAILAASGSKLPYFVCLMISTPQESNSCNCILCWPCQLLATKLSFRRPYAYRLACSVATTEPPEESQRSLARIGVVGEPGILQG